MDHNELGFVGLERALMVNTKTLDRWEICFMGHRSISFFGFGFVWDVPVIWPYLRALFFLPWWLPFFFPPSTLLLTTGWQKNFRKLIRRWKTPVSKPTRRPSWRLKFPKWKMRSRPWRRRCLTFLIRTNWIHEESTSFWHKNLPSKTKKTHHGNFDLICFFVPLFSPAFSLFQSGKNIHIFFFRLEKINECCS